MSDDFQAGLPSVRQVQDMIKDATEVEIKLVTGDLMTGKFLWQDTNCLCLQDHFNQPTIIWRQALVFIKPKP